MASKESEKQMIKVLQDLLRQLYEVETIAGDFNQPNSQDLLLARLRELTQGIQLFKERAGAYKNIQVPVPLLQYVDAGGHPDDFVRNTFTQAMADNQLAAGRVAAVQALRDELMAQAAAAFPEAAAVYNSVAQEKQQQAAAGSSAAP